MTQVAPAPAVGEGGYSLRHNERRKYVYQRYGD